jgi:hypothetical protein
MATKKATVQARAKIIKLVEESEVKTKKEIDWDKWAKVAAVVGIFITILGIIWIAHKELIEIESRQSKMEGQLDIILKDRETLLETYKKKRFSY